MKRNHIIVGLLLFLTALGFSYYFTPYLHEPARPPSYKHVVIKMERTACFGKCPVYSVQITEDGRVTYEGKQFVKVMGKQTAYISQSDVRRLVDAFFDKHYFSLHSVYHSNMTDATTTYTSITIDGLSKKVENYVDGPKRLFELQDMIDEVAQTEQWVGNGESE